MAEIHVQQGESSVAVSIGDLVVVRLVEPGATGLPMGDRPGR